MKRTTIKDILNYPGPAKNVTIGGWLRTARHAKNFSFLEVNDGSVFNNLQVIADRSMPGYDQVLKLSTGACIIVKGDLVESPGKKQKFEIQARKVLVVGDSPEDYPLQKKRHSFEFLRTIAHLRPRTNTFGAVFRTRSELSFAIHDFFHQHGFVYVHTPIITGSDCEGAGKMFRVTTLDLDRIPRINGKIDFTQDFFGRPTNLTVSGQLEGETFALSLGNIYTFGPTFRAENSNTPRHCAEFWMVEPEMAFYDLDDTIELAEKFIKYIISYVRENCRTEIEFFNQWIDKGLIERLDHVIKSKFEVISYTEAIDLLKQADRKFTFPVEWGQDLQTEHERYLTEEKIKKPVFVVNYPKQIKAFYMRLNDDNRTVAALDLLVPKIGEIIGGSQREERFQVLLGRIKEMNLDPGDYWWYLDTRKFGTAPHAGFGLGFERTLMYITGMDNIRDVIPFPRTPKNADF